MLLNNVNKYLMYKYRVKIKEITVRKYINYHTNYCKILNLLCLNGKPLV